MFTTNEIPDIVFIVISAKAIIKLKSKLGFYNDCFVFMFHDKVLCYLVHLDTKYYTTP